MNVYLYKIEYDLMQAEEQRLLASLPAFRREKAEKLINQKARYESMAAALLVRKVLGLSEEEFQSCREEKGPMGKPLLYGADEKKLPLFNLSHSVGYLALAISNQEDMPVGIDLETKDDKELRVSRRMFTQMEYEWIQNAANPQKEFRRVWTEKESFLKCTGQGISVKLSSFHVNRDSGKVESDGYTFQDSPFGKEYFVKTFFAEDESFAMSVCCQKKDFTFKMHEVNSLFS